MANKIYVSRHIPAHEERMPLTIPGSDLTNENTIEVVPFTRMTEENIKECAKDFQQWMFSNVHYLFYNELKHLLNEEK
jgi:hypothetical protein